jgi:SAM-dependent methyltransferase
MEYPASIARFYDTIYHRVRSSVDLDYYMERIRKSVGPVLEIGAGTGRLFCGALQEGADIYAVEPSAAMLDILYSKLKPEHHSRIQDKHAGNFSFEQKFDLILAPFRVFSHILNIDDQLKALNNIHTHLSKHGRFVMDLFVPDPGMIANGLQDVEDFDEEFSPGNRLSRTVSMQANVVNQISDIRMILKWNEGDRHFEDTWEMQMRFYYRYELEHLVERSRLNLLEMLGDFEGNPLSRNSKEFILVCTA